MRVLLVGAEAVVMSSLVATSRDLLQLDIPIVLDVTMQEQEEWVSCRLSVLGLLEGMQACTANLSVRRKQQVSQQQSQ